jgi:hypothetical protein
LKIEEFLELTLEEVVELVDKHMIQTVYLPIDGTRRYFQAISGMKHSDEQFYKRYFESSISSTVSLLEKLYDYNIKHIILLLMDDTAFSRGKEYLNASIQLGIIPTVEHETFLKLYSSKNIRVTFGGFNEMYTKFGYDELLVKFRQLEQKTEVNKACSLTYFTGSSSSNDYLLFTTKYQNLVSKNQSLEEIKKEIIKDLYGLDLPPISMSFFYNYPRDKILPPLLWEQSVNFYMKNPSLSMSDLQIKKGIYYTIKSKSYIKDNYKEYDNSSKEVLEMNLENSNYIGESDYYS